MAFSSVVIAMLRALQRSGQPVRSPSLRRAIGQLDELELISRSGRPIRKPAAEVAEKPVAKVVEKELEAAQKSFKESAKYPTTPGADAAEQLAKTEELRRADIDTDITKFREAEAAHQGPKGKRRIQARQKQARLGVAAEKRRDDLLETRADQLFDPADFPDQQLLPLDYTETLAARNVRPVRMPRVDEAGLRKPFGLGQEESLRRKLDSLETGSAAQIQRIDRPRGYPIPEEALAARKVETGETARPFTPGLEGRQIFRAMLPGGQRSVLELPENLAQRGLEPPRAVLGGPQQGSELRSGGPRGSIDILSRPLPAAPRLTAQQLRDMQPTLPGMRRGGPKFQYKEAPGLKDLRGDQIAQLTDAQRRSLGIRKDVWQDQRLRQRDLGLGGKTPLTESADARKLKSMPAERETGQYISEAQGLRIINSVDTTRPLGPRNKAMLLLLAGTGLRNMELRQLTQGTVLEAYQTGILKIYHGKGGKYREVPLTKQVAAALKEYDKERFTLVQSQVAGADPESIYFLSKNGKELTRKTVREPVFRHGKLHGLRLSPHNFRHMFAQGMLEKGATVEEVQKLMGHANYQETLDYGAEAIRAAKERQGGGRFERLDVGLSTQPEEGSLYEAVIGQGRDQPAHTLPNILSQSARTSKRQFQGPETPDRWSFKGAAWDRFDKETWLTHRILTPPTVTAIPEAELAKAAQVSLNPSLLDEGAAQLRAQVNWQPTRVSKYANPDAMYDDFDRAVRELADTGKLPTDPAIGREMAAFVGPKNVDELVRIAAGAEEWEIQGIVRALEHERQIFEAVHTKPALTFVGWTAEEIQMTKGLLIANERRKMIMRALDHAFQTAGERGRVWGVDFKTKSASGKDALKSLKRGLTKALGQKGELPFLKQVLNAAFSGKSPRRILDKKTVTYRLRDWNALNKELIFILGALTGIDQLQV